MENNVDIMEGKCDGNMESSDERDITKKLDSFLCALLVLSKQKETGTKEGQTAMINVKNVRKC